MGYTHGYSINLDQTIKFDNNAPLDVRLVVPSVDDLTTMTNAYQGLVTFVQNENKLYICTAALSTGSTWEPLKMGSNSIPFYTQAQLDAMEEKDRPDKYILIGDKESDLLRSVNLETDKSNKLRTVSNSNKIPNDGTYVDIFYSALRKLQTEVTKIKNSFKYGINSYTGNKFNDIIPSDSSTSIEEEPLWAIDEEGLTEILDCYDQGKHFIKIDERALIETDSQVPTTLTFKNGAINVNLLDDKGTNILSSILDAKIVLFLTTNNLNISITLNNGVVIDLSNVSLTSTAEKYNVMLVISRAIEGKGGENYVWCTIDNAITDKKVAEGYYKDGIFGNEKHLLEVTEKLYITEIQIDATSPITIEKLKVCTKYQDFSNNIISSKPNYNDEYKYEAAHITIRSVENYATLDASTYKSALLPNELIMVEQDSEDKKHKAGLYIKSLDVIKPVGTGDNASSSLVGGNITVDSLVNKLANIGINAKWNENKKEETTISFNRVSGVTFIHEPSNSSYLFKIDSEGKLHSIKINNNLTLSSRIAKLNSNTATDSSSFIKYEQKENDNYNYFHRGVVGEVNVREDYASGKTDVGHGFSNRKLKSDRIKIGAFYAPLDTNKVNGCTHAYVELENTSDVDFELDGVYLYHFRTVLKDGDYVKEVNYLKLEGSIPAGGTYLIRGKKYTDFNDANAFIKVETFDIEWYMNGKLVDLSYTDIKDKANGFALLYGDYTQNLENLPNMELVHTNPNSKESTYLYIWGYIDSLYYGNYETGKTNWVSKVNSCMTIPSNAKCKDVIFKNAFMLDPANQAYQGLFDKDSSRIRNNTASDYYYIPLDIEYIEFPKTEEVYHISKFTPKASFEKKNISNDKTQPDFNKPNMLTCSFGINPYTTRCFNWVSMGLFNEYIWIRKEGTSTWYKFESYTEADLNEDKSLKKTVPVNQSIYTRKGFNGDIINTVYTRITSTFPGHNIKYTSHKCIIEINTDGFTIPTKFEYVAGKADKNGNFIPEKSTEIYTFTLYPSSYKPRIYHTSDQQGFHWIEYQVWAAAAKHLNEEINAIKDSDKIFPVILNTGDMTQSGSRINEWLDYYNGGKCLFNHLEQVNVVGNNDLCGTNELILGTGDDIGKSNSYYFHIFYCYEMDPEIPTIIKGKYVPSTYYIDFNEYRLLCVNSELTVENAKNWFGLTKTVGEVEYTVNPYTGWFINPAKPSNVSGGWFNGGENNFDSSFTTVYTMLYKMTENLAVKPLIAACHEMPFTVITKENLEDKTNKVSRSLNGSSLVGCHMNQISNTDILSNYWFSRLMEYRGCKLVLGGHKHTYAITHPIRENYYYKNNADDTSIYDSSIHGPMNMKTSLKDDYVSFEGVDKNLSKFPLVVANEGLNKITETTLTGSFYPIEKVSSFVEHSKLGTSGIVYFMMQATGYKLFSNKELPSFDQLFSQYIPKASVQKDGTVKATPDQCVPMYGIIDIVEDTSTAKKRYELQLIRIMNIVKTTYNNTKTDSLAYKYLPTRYNISKSDLYTPFAYSNNTNFEKQYLRNYKELFDKNKDNATDPSTFYIVHETLGTGVIYSEILEPYRTGIWHTEKGNVLTIDIN